MTPDPHKADPHEWAFLQLIQAYGQSRRLTERELSPFGITIAEYTLLRILQNTPHITASQARTRLATTAPSLAQLVKSLSRKGMIRRSADRVDTRRQPIDLTAKGKKTIEKARSAIQQTLRKLVVSPATVRTLTDALSDLLTSLSSYGR